MMLDKMMYIIISGYTMKRKEKSAYAREIVKLKIFSFI
jgi:hypothetical protein